MRIRQCDGGNIKTNSLPFKPRFHTYRTVPKPYEYIYIDLFAFTPMTLSLDLLACSKGFATKANPERGGKKRARGREREGATAIHGQKVRLNKLEPPTHAQKASFGPMAPYPPSRQQPEHRPPPIATDPRLFPGREPLHSQTPLAEWWLVSEGQLSAHNDARSARARDESGWGVRQHRGARCYSHWGAKQLFSISATWMAVLLQKSVKLTHLRRWRGKWQVIWHHGEVTRSCNAGPTTIISTMRAISVRETVLIGE